MAGIYIHIPFCKKKCIYCSFYSIASIKCAERYREAIIKEFKVQSSKFNCRWLQPTVQKDSIAVGFSQRIRKVQLPLALATELEKIETIYFGGGTPTLLSVNLLEKILKAVHENFDVADEIECTIEGNPEQLSLDFLTDLKQIGFNRISIGIQSFNDNILQLLGRTHSGKDAFFAIKNAEKAGFENISVDLIYGIYLRSLQDWAVELETVFQLPVKHLSAYSLTVEENTLLHKKITQQKMPTPDEEQSLKEMEMLIEAAEKNGFQHYEVSNFALTGYHSKHNSNYWNGTPYFGFGASAHSFSGNTRSWNVANVEKYIQAIENDEPCFEVEHLTQTEQYNEYVLLRLRTKTGIDLQDLEAHFGKEKSDFFLKSLQKINPEYYHQQSQKISITKAGLPLLDWLISHFFI